MDSTPPCRLARMDSDPGSDPDQIPHFSVEYARPPPAKKTPSSVPAKLSRPAISVPLHDLLVMSPSPVRRSRTRLEKARTSGGGLVGCASPRGGRRSRRRLEAEEREYGVVAEKKRQSGRSLSRKEKLGSLVNSTLPSANEDDEWIHSTLDGIAQLIKDLIMWRDVAKSSFWLGLGCVCFLSSCFTGGFSFSVLSVLSRLGLLLLGFSFLSNTLLQRKSMEKRQGFRLKEDDIVRAARLALPAINLIITKTKRLFSGEASTTLKVAVFLSIGAEYGHLLTLWRICAIGFFASFSVPKLYSLYAEQIDLKVESWKLRVLEAWKCCSHKKVVVASIATAFWNLSSLKTRIFVAFLSLVILRYFRQTTKANLEEEEDETMVQEQEEKPQQALVVAKPTKP